MIGGANCVMIRFTFKSATELGEHIREMHKATDKIPCPQCEKRFPSFARLMAHIESGSRKCGIRQDEDMFSRAIKEYTGGFVKVLPLKEQGR
jgi:hypothetical protein